MISKKEIEKFILVRKGYLKKSPHVTLEAIWKSLPKTTAKTIKEAQKELELVKSVQSELREADKIIHSTSDLALLETYNLIHKERERPKRKLFFDIEVSPNIVTSWRIGSDIKLSHENIIQERAVICICWKWSDSDKVESLQWKDGDDYEMLVKFAKIIDSADETVTQNGDSFDIKWLRTRCLYHRIELSPKFNSIDTLKMARAGFKFNSNKLDYMGQFLGLGEKIKTEPDLWKNIVLKNCKVSMKKMIDYCKQDVNLLELVYNELQSYSPIKKFKYKIPLK